MDILSTAVTQVMADGPSAPYRWSRPNIDQWDPLVEVLTISRWREFARLVYDGVSPHLREVLGQAKPSGGHAQYAYDKQTGLLQRELRRCYDVLTYLFEK